MTRKSALGTFLRENGIPVTAKPKTRYSYGHEEFRNPKLGNSLNDVVSPSEGSPKTINMEEANAPDLCPVYTIGKTREGGNVYLCSITNCVTYLHEYIKLLNCLDTATANDIIEININSPGGYISTATQICTAIRNCKAKVRTHASGICASAGSLIWSVGHEVSVGDLALFMWHMSSHSDSGNSIAIHDEAGFQIEYVKNVLLNISLESGFITSEEMNLICTNPDDAVWISAEEMRRRIAEKNQPQHQFGKEED